MVAYSTEFSYNILYFNGDLLLMKLRENREGEKRHNIYILIFIYVIKHSTSQDFNFKTFI